MAIIDPTIDIILCAVLLTLANVAATRILGVRKRMNEIQAEFKEYQKKISDASKAKDEKLMTKIYESEGERMNNMMMEMAFMPWKTIFISLPLFMIFTGEPWFTHFPGLMLTGYHGFQISLPFDLHPAAVYSLHILQNAVYGPRGFFIVSVLFAGMIISFAEQKIDAKRTNAKPPK